MKITITSYEGEPEFTSFTAEIINEANERQFIDALERVAQAFFPGLIIEAHRREAKS